MARFLICDDARFMRMVAERVLEKLGHQIIYTAENGQDAIDWFEQNQAEVDVIILDVVMPKMDGLQVLRRLLQVNPEIKIIMVTAISSGSIVSGAMRAGALEFVTKPFKLSELVKAVNKVVET